MSHLMDDRSFSEDHLIQQLYQTMRVFSKTLNNTISDSDLQLRMTILKLVRSMAGFPSQKSLTIWAWEPWAISKTPSRLEKKQIIERRYLPGLRGKHIFLTSHGEELCRWRSWLQNIGNGLLQGFLSGSAQAFPADAAGSSEIFRRMSERRFPGK